MIHSKSLSLKALSLWAILALLPTIASSKVVLRDPCIPKTVTLVIEVVYTSTGFSALPTTTVTETFTSTAGVPFTTPAGSGSSPSTGGSAAADPCPTATQYSIAFTTLGPQNTRTITKSVTVTVSAGTSLPPTTPEQTSSRLSSSTVTRSVVTTSIPELSSSAAETSGAVISSSPPSTTSSSMIIPRPTSETSDTEIFSALSYSTPSTALLTRPIFVTSATSFIQPSTTSNTTPVPKPTFWLKASDVAYISGTSNNTLLPRSNDKYARLFTATPADTQESQNLDFALTSNTSASVFTLDEQGRLFEIHLGLVATSQYGTAQKVFFDPIDNLLSGYTAIICIIQAASDPSAYATLQCTGSGSTTGAQTLEAVCYGSSSTTADGANGKLFLASSLTTVASDCRSVTLNVVPYTINVAI